MIRRWIEDVRTYIVRRRRRSLFRSEADPLFFQFARGEINEDEWLDKVQEIRDRIPHRGPHWTGWTGF